MKIKCTRILLLCVLISLMSGCGDSDKDNQYIDGYSISYINKNVTKISQKAYEPNNTDMEALVEELLEELSKDTDSVDYRKAIPDDVTINKYQIDGKQLLIYFNKQYEKMDAITEVLCRAAVVRTLTQIDGIDCVSFFVGDAPLKNSNGEIVGVMNADSFIENPEEQINSIMTTTLNLYFADENGEKLVKESKLVHYSSNISLEKLVVEKLIDGPETKGLQGTIPQGTNLVNVTVSEGVCYVNLDEGFMNQNYGIAEEVVIYSIVDSLSELASVSRIQISVNGESSGKYRDKLRLDTLYERNLDYVQNVEEENANE